MDLKTAQKSLLGAAVDMGNVVITDPRVQSHFSFMGSKIDAMESKPWIWAHQAAASDHPSALSNHINEMLATLGEWTPDMRDTTPSEEEKYKLNLLEDARSGWKDETAKQRFLIEVTKDTSESFFVGFLLNQANQKAFGDLVKYLKESGHLDDFLLHMNYRIIGDIGGYFHTHLLFLEAARVVGFDSNVNQLGSMTINHAKYNSYYRNQLASMAASSPSPQNALGYIKVLSKIDFRILDSDQRTILNSKLRDLLDDSSLKEYERTFLSNQCNHMLL